MGRKEFIFRTKVLILGGILKILCKWDLKHNIYRGLERVNRVLRTIDDYNHIDVLLYSILIQDLMPICTDYICDATYKLRNEFMTEFYAEMGRGAL